MGHDERLRVNAEVVEIHTTERAVFDWYVHCAILVEASVVEHQAPFIAGVELNAIVKASATILLHFGTCVERARTVGVCGVQYVEESWSHVPMLPEAPISDKPNSNWNQRRIVVMMSRNRRPRFRSGSARNCREGSHPHTPRPTAKAPGTPWPPGAALPPSHAGGARCDHARLVAVAAWRTVARWRCPAALSLHRHAGGWRWITVAPRPERRGDPAPATRTFVLVSAGPQSRPCLCCFGKGCALATAGLLLTCEDRKGNSPYIGARARNERFRFFDRARYRGSGTDPLATRLVPRITVVQGIKKGDPLRSPRPFLAI